MPVEPRRVRDLFLAATDLVPERRPAFLAEVCGADAELRAAVERLLVAHAAPASILDPASVSPPATETVYPGSDPAPTGPAPATGSFDAASLHTGSYTPRPKVSAASSPASTSWWRRSVKGEWAAYSWPSRPSR